MKTAKPIISLSCVFILALFVLSLIAPLPVLCGEPPKNPILRLETGMHTDLIGTIGVDAQNRFLVSGSMDKTVRVWELPGGRLVATLRPPIGKYEEGKISAVDISPDGSTIVAAGLTGYNWDQKRQVTIYIFDRLSGGMKKRIKELPQTVTKLRFSPDGEYLVAGLTKACGIRIYRTSDWSLIQDDRDYKDYVSGVAFDTKGKLVTAAADGFIRVYDANFRLPPRIKKASGENELASVAFSPDGSKIAIGYCNSVRVDVHSSSPDLRYLFSADTTGVPISPCSSLMSICWASDGSLYAGGNYRDDRMTYYIRRWVDGGKGPYADLPASQSTVFSLLPLKDGGIAFACTNGIGAFDSHGRKTLDKVWDIPDQLDRLLVSDDAKIVQFCFDAARASAARFSLAKRLIELEPEELPTLKAAITEAEAIKVEDWEYKSAGIRADSPKLNGKPLKLREHETSYSYAICPGGQSFLLGTGSNIWLFDKNGTMIWRIPAVSIVWSLNVARNGVFIASFADGTIRWYRVKDGEELLAFFPHRDNKRWVLWTPKGYYDASIGGEDLVGWHVNKSIEQAAYFFPISRFRSTYYRPDITQEVLNTLDEAEAVTRANNKAGIKEGARPVQEILPPVVEIISPVDNSPVATKTLTIQYRVRSPAGDPATGIRVFVDGGLYKEERALNLVGADIIREIQVDLPERDSEISIVAQNVHGWGETGKRRLRWARPRDEQKGVLYVVAVGVSNYQDEGLQKGVKHAAQDARDFAKLMREQERGSLYREVHVTELPDDQATRDSIMTVLSEIGEGATINDLIILFLSGHGEKDRSGKYRYLLAGVDQKRLPSRCLSHSDIKDPLAGFPGRRVVFIDTCRSGFAIDISGFANELASGENGRIVVFTSATGDQSSEEPPGAENGAFTEVLLQGLNGKAANEQKRVTASRLHVVLEEEVPKLTKNRQKPGYIDLGGGALELAEVIN